MARDDVDYNSRGNGPACTKCGHNEQVMKSKLTWRPRLIGTKIPLWYTNNLNGWWCHNHDPGIFCGEA